MSPEPTTSNPLRALVRRLRRGHTSEAARDSQRGQVLPIFAIMALVLLGGAALLTDVAWWWTNEQRMQRAADAAALAGAIYLPVDQTKAYEAARAEAVRNGYTHGSGGIVVQPRRDPQNERKLIVDIDGPVQTNFARVFCWRGGPCLQNVPVGVTGAAEFVLPVPMGSPENYYGVFGMVRNATSSSMQDLPPVTGWSCSSGSGWNESNGCVARVPTSTNGPANWTTSSGTLVNAVNSENNVYARTSATNAQRWAGFGAQTGIQNPAAGETLTITSLQARLTDTRLDNACNGSNRTAAINVALSWDGGTSWTNSIRVPTTPTASLSTTQNDYVVGGATSAWGAHAWTRAELANLEIRLTPAEDCTNNPEFRVDMIDIRVGWSYVARSLVTTNLPNVLLRGPGSACPNVTWTTGTCFQPDGQNLNERGFWATLNTQGAENINGDAYQPGYDTRTNRVSPPCPVATRACYDGRTFYNYAIEMPPNATNGKVYVYDPQFCAVDEDSGTGDRWFGDSVAVTTNFALYDTKSSLYDLAEDEPPIISTQATDLDLFRQMDWDDSTMGGSGGDECMRRTDVQYGDERDFHGRWFLLNPDSGDSMTGGTAGKVYRIHTSSTDPGNTTQQLGSNGENSFAIYVSATVPSGGPSPRVYGLGAMQAFTPLSSNSPIDSTPGATSEFYLAQIEDAHAGKTIEIRLWDPGDTRPLRAELQILRPIDNGPANPATSTGWTVSNFSYTAAQGTEDTSRADCNSLTGNNVSQVRTNTGDTNGTFNGCWLTMRAVIPDDYEANEDGWWRIRYRMDGNGTSNDVTTWQVNLIGNPVHLVPE